MSASVIVHTLGAPPAAVKDTTVRPQTWTRHDHPVPAGPDQLGAGDRADLAPVFADAVRARTADATAAADEAFDVALTAMLDGFRLRLAAARS